MKKIILALLALTASGTLMAQASVAEMMQLNWPMALDANRQFAEFPIAATYYRDFKPFGDASIGGVVRDYFISGRLQMD